MVAGIDHGVGRSAPSAHPSAVFGESALSGSDYEFFAEFPHPVAEPRPAADAMTVRRRGAGAADAQPRVHHRRSVQRHATASPLPGRRADQITDSPGQPSTCPARLTRERGLPATPGPCPRCPVRQMGTIRRQVCEETRILTVNVDTHRAGGQIFEVLDTAANAFWAAATLERCYEMALAPCGKH